MNNYIDGMFSQGRNVHAGVILSEKLMQKWFKGGFMSGDDYNAKENGKDNTTFKTILPIQSDCVKKISFLWSWNTIFDHKLQRSLALGIYYISLHWPKQV